MKLSITLPDPKYCNGCPCCNYDETEEPYCKSTHEVIRIPNEFPMRRGALVIRPAICIKTNGE